MVKKKKATKKRSTKLSKLRQFLISLSKDPEKRNAFKNDPERVIEEAGLSEEHRRLVTSHDLKDLRQLLIDLAAEELGDELG